MSFRPEALAYLRLVTRRVGTVDPVIASLTPFPPTTLRRRHPARTRPRNDLLPVSWPAVVYLRGEPFDLVAVERDVLRLFAQKEADSPGRPACLLQHVAAE